MVVEFCMGKKSSLLLDRWMDVVNQEFSCLCCLPKIHWSLLVTASLCCLHFRLAWSLDGRFVACFLISVKLVQLTSPFSDRGLVNFFGGSYFLAYTNLSFVHEEFRGFDTLFIIFLLIFTYSVSIIWSGSNSCRVDSPDSWEIDGGITKCVCALIVNLFISKPSMNCLLSIQFTWVIVPNCSFLGFRILMDWLSPGLFFGDGSAVLGI